MGSRANGRARRPVGVLAGLLAALVTAGCATVVGPAQTQNRPVSAVSTVELTTVGSLVLTSGDPPSLHITAGSGVIDHLTSDVRGDKLTLGTDGKANHPGTVHYDLVLPAARVVELSGVGSVHVTGPSALQQVLVPGSGQLRIDELRTDELAVDLSGAGNVTVAGSTTRQRVSIDGVGRYDGAGLISQDAEVTVSGAGSADVAADRTLTATISGTGTITYAGTAAVTTSVTGAGSVVRR